MRHLYPLPAPIAQLVPAQTCRLRLRPRVESRACRAVSGLDVAVGHGVFESRHEVETAVVAHGGELVISEALIDEGVAREVVRVGHL